ncbi:MAG: HAD family hydrolase [Acidobacteria bacterium]|nr:HAD family hydrolase [Acidobacteriota bacterium]
MHEPGSSLPRRKSFVLLDRDGTVVVEKNYLTSIDQLVLLPNAVKGLQALARAGCGLVIVTNQSAIGRGLISRMELDRVHAELRDMLRTEGIPIAGIYYCPHLPAEQCACRKPRAGLAEEAATELGFDLRNSFVVGDKPCDIDLGRNCGAKTVLVRTGYGRQYETEGLSADFVVDDLLAAADVIIDYTCKDQSHQPH